MPLVGYHTSSCPLMINSYQKTGVGANGFLSGAKGVADWKLLWRSGVTRFGGNGKVAKCFVAIKNVRNHP